MKRLNHIFLITVVALLFACNSNTDKKENTEIVKTQIAEQDNRIEPEPKEKEPNQDFDCVRGQAEPIVIKDIYPNTTFTLQPDSLTAIETIELDNGEKVIIKNWGCEYYILSFQFETSKYNTDTTAMKYWYVNSYKLMDEIKEGIDAPIDIEKGLQAFNDHISRNVFDLELETEIDYGENEIRNFVSLDNISKIENNRFAVTISFAVGPL
jgi:hypothetical protein|tara:strand:- start:225 stop:854 length:630 start_codon:yes stop_codon:yes gene_type:complete